MYTQRYDERTVYVSGLDVHEDTPIEILHTVLLGVVKYFWAHTYYVLEKSKYVDTFRARLNSLDSNGLNIPPIPGDYMCQYRGGLIGKHFKILAQVMSFAVAGLVSDDVLKGWLLIGDLTVLLWYTSIRDTDQYLVRMLALSMYTLLTRISFFSEATRDHHLECAVGGSQVFPNDYCPQTKMACSKSYLGIYSALWPSYSVLHGAFRVVQPCISPHIHV